MNLTRRKFVGLQLFFFGSVFSRKIRSRLLFLVDPEKDKKLVQEYFRTLYPLKNPRVQWSRRGDKTILAQVDPSAGSPLIMNETGGFIWERCDGTTSLMEIARKISKQFRATEETCMADTFAHLQYLEKQGMITIRRKPGDQPA